LVNPTQPITRPRALRCSTFILCLLIAVFVAHPVAAEGLPADPAGLARRAGVVVAGEIVQVRPGAHPRYPRLGVTFVTLRVSEAFKGARPGLLTFMQIGHAGDTLPPLGGARFMLIPDLPHYRPGEEVILFLYPTTETGLTSPVGGRRGKWPLTRDARSGELELEERVLSAGKKAEGIPYARVRTRLRAAIAATGAGRAR
jgi:hypothetical protein